MPPRSRYTKHHPSSFTRSPQLGSTLCHCIDCSPPDVAELSREIYTRLREAPDDATLGITSYQSLAFDVKGLMNLRTRITKHIRIVSRCDDARNFINHALEAHLPILFELEKLFRRTRREGLRLSFEDSKYARGLVFGYMQTLYTVWNVLATYRTPDPNIDDLDSILSDSLDDDSLSDFLEPREDERGDRTNRPSFFDMDFPSNRDDTRQVDDDENTARGEDMSKSTGSKGAASDKGPDHPGPFLRVGTQVLGFLDSLLKEKRKARYNGPNGQAPQDGADRGEEIAGLRSLFAGVMSGLKKERQDGSE